MKFQSLFYCIASCLFLLSFSANASEDRNPQLISYPVTLDKDCRDGRAKIFDECGDQLKLFKAALRRAKTEDKTLLVSFGAEWCIWCHVFDKYINGVSESFTHTYSDPRDAYRDTSTLLEKADYDAKAEAKDLTDFVAKHFVIVHIDYKYSDKGVKVLEKTNAKEHFDGGMPFIFTVNRKGKFSKMMVASDVETRRDTEDWFRGYDRAKLKRVLEDMRKASK